MTFDSDNSILKSKLSAVNIAVDSSKHLSLISILDNVSSMSISLTELSFKEFSGKITREPWLTAQIKLCLIVRFFMGLSKILN